MLGSFVKVTSVRQFKLVRSGRSLYFSLNLLTFLSFVSFFLRPALRHPLLLFDDSFFNHCFFVSLFLIPYLPLLSPVSFFSYTKDAF